MKIIKDKKNTQFDIIQKGYSALYREMGPTDTLRFVMSFYRGSGDSVKQFNDLWGSKTIDQIVKQIKAK